jgi:hypothetical protein
MGRHMKRRLARPGPALWIPTRDRRGQWQIVDVHGNDPLRSEDPAVRIQAIHLAAAAPELRSVLAEVTRRMEAIVPVYSGQRLKDGRLLQLAWGTLALTSAPLGEYLKIERGQQLELDLAA